MMMKMLHNRDSAMDVIESINLDIDVPKKLKEGSQNLLTKRESLIASYLMLGYSIKEITKMLHRSQHTIKMHVKNIKNKCHCKSQVRLGVILQNFLKNTSFE